MQKRKNKLKIARHRKITLFEVAAENHKNTFE